MRKAIKQYNLFVNYPALLRNCSKLRTSGAGAYCQHMLHGLGTYIPSHLSEMKGKYILVPTVCLSVKYVAI